MRKQWSSILEPMKTKKSMAIKKPYCSRYWSSIIGAVSGEAITGSLYSGNVLWFEKWISPNLLINRLKDSPLIPW